MFPFFVRLSVRFMCIRSFFIFMLVFVFGIIIYCFFRTAIPEFPEFEVRIECKPLTGSTHQQTWSCRLRKCFVSTNDIENSSALICVVLKQVKIQT
jgi:hypothetical protein